MSGTQESSAADAARIEALERENAILRATVDALTGALRSSIERYRREAAEIDEILAASPQLFEKARAAKADRAKRRVERAEALRKSDGLSAPQIGIRMAHEEGQPKPFSERTVRRWLAPKRPAPAQKG